jgi:hypothetical protein
MQALEIPKQSHKWDGKGHFQGLPEKLVQSLRKNPQMRVVPWKSGDFSAA